MGNITKILLGAVALVAFVLFSYINNVPKLDEAVGAAASQLDNQYKRRSDLIPNLVSTVKGYASHEKEVFTEVTNARAKVGQMTLDESVLNNPELLKKFEAAQGELGAALSKLLAVSENYPDLKASTNFLELQAQLEGTENRIAVARKDYITAVKKYNIELRTIPGKWVASFLYPEAQLKENFKATPKETTVPKVDFKG